LSLKKRGKVADRARGRGKGLDFSNRQARLERRAKLGRERRFTNGGGAWIIVVRPPFLMIRNAKKRLRTDKRVAREGK